MNTPVQQLQPPQMLQGHLVSICRAHKVLCFNDTKSQTRASISIWQHHPHPASLKPPYSRSSTRPLLTGGEVQPKSVSILPLPGQSPAPCNQRKQFSLHLIHPVFTPGVPLAVPLPESRTLSARAYFMDWIKPKRASSRSQYSSRISMASTR